MYKSKKVCIVIPAFNEEVQIRKVIETIPCLTDCILIVDDASSDNTVTVIREYQEKDSRIQYLMHQKNMGCGGALASGYHWAKNKDFDIIVRMDGDGQMNPSDLEFLLNPIAEEKADYVKGNRFMSGDTYQHMPKIRYFGNAFLSLLTKIVSGYWHIADFQSGYTAMSQKVLKTIDWNKMYKGYGQPNDLIIRLNVYNFRVMDVPVKALYQIGEKSRLKYKKVIFTISFMLIRMFFWRMKEKYIIRDFHPLVFFYFLGIAFSILTLILFGRVFILWGLDGHIPAINALAAFFSFISATQFIVFAMWFDMEANKQLK